MISSSASARSRSFRVYQAVQHALDAGMCAGGAADRSEQPVKAAVRINRARAG
jgi:hypothetical protein